jgi:hypothetical protein
VPRLREAISWARLGRMPIDEDPPRPIDDRGQGSVS